MEDAIGEPKAHLGRAAEVTQGYVEGVPVEALCGAHIVPSRDAERLEPCEACERGLELLRLARES